MEPMPFRLALFVGLFAGLVIAVNLLGTKIVSLFGISVSVGIFILPLMFVVTDVVTEVYGKAVSTRLVWIGVIVQTVVLAYTLAFIALPPHERYIYNDEYVRVFGSSARIIVASLAAFILAQFYDIIVFQRIKKMTGERWLWLRSNVSTFASQAIDTFVFMFIAFYQVAPKFTAAFIVSLAIPYYLFKIAFAVLDTPFVYAGVKWLKRG